jgi:predicted unusual protein kinase regulating ubiquinone biosynthesis (AarF/ABC1/UbiB family)
MITNLLKIPYLRLKYKFLPSKEQQFWAQELLNSQGLSAKIGQILGQGKITQLPKSSITPKEAKILFQKAFGKEILISDEVLAASMGQVFFIKIENQKYAVKILHPGIKKKLQSEIENILLLGGYFSKAKGFSFNKDIFKNFLTEVFEEETDLVREAHFQQRFFEIFENDERFTIPRVIKDFSTSSFLTQEEVISNLAKDLRTFSQFHIFDFFLHSLLQHGLLHGDLNDRNWGVRDSGQVAVYDYGCSQIVSERRINGFKKLLSNIDVKEGFKEFGIRLEASTFKNKEQELRDALFGPLLNAPISPSWNYSEELKTQYGEKIKELREFTDPWVLLMMRSLFSLIRVYQDRKVAIPLNDLVNPYLKQKEASMKATQIKINVLENQKSVISMTLPMSALDNLDTLMPPKVTDKIQESGINIKEIIKNVYASDFTPQDLFNLSIEARNYRVWIE